MSKITRYSGNVVPFANNAQAGERFVFGSSTEQSNDLTTLVSANYLRGWGVVGPSDFPPLEWFNAQAFTSTQFIAYLHQMGVAEWSGEQEYHENSAVNRNGVLYYCKTNDHVSATPPESDPTNWRKSQAEDVSYDNTESGLASTDVQGAIDEVEARVDTVDERLNEVEKSGADKLLIKTDSMKVMFDLAGSVLTLNQDVVIKGTRILSGTTVSLPSLVNASDYRILLLSDGNLSAQLYDSADPVGSVTVGGFHVYHTTGGINPRSLWDENWKPSSKSPRAMALSYDENVWADIYLIDTAYALNNYSRPDVTIADGDSPPIIPEIYGGNGVITYGSLTWFEAWDLVINAGKRLVFWGEFSGLAYGVVEQQSVGVDPVTTKYQVGQRSAIGLEQATGTLWTWGADTQGSSGSAAAITKGRGSVYSDDPRAVMLGGDWSVGVDSGSRSVFWGSSPDNSNYIISVRAVCDHLIL